MTARGGSKGVPRKNLRLLHGKSLLRYTAEAALGARRLARVVLSTEDREIAEEGRRCGLDVPFVRPDELALDETPTLPVLRHAVLHLEASGDRYDAVCLLQPTDPLRTPEQIDGCVDLLDSAGADAVVTVLRVPAEYNPHWVYFLKDDGTLRLSTGEDAPIPRRQDLPAAFHRSGSVYVTRRDVLIDGDSLYGRRLAGYLVARDQSVNIDTPEDLERAERLLTLKGN